jgi:murein DD-endopeptidase MepM/ murein hydrolase activator NlpD
VKKPRAGKTTPQGQENLTSGLDSDFDDDAEDPGKIDDPEDAWPSQSVARRQSYRRRRKSSAPSSSASMWLGGVLVTLTAVNVYVFFFRDDTSVKKLLAPKTGAAMADKGAGASPPGKTKLAMLPGSAEPTSPTGLSQPAAGAASSGTAFATPKGGATNGQFGQNGEGALRAAGVDPEGRVVEGSIGENDTLGGVIDREGLGPSAPNVLRALSRLHDPRSIRPGDGYSIFFNAEAQPQVFEYRPSPIVRYIITRAADDTWSGRKEEKPIEVRAETTGASIDSSLYESVTKAGEGPALAGQLVELFAWDINFYTDTHPGDRWRMVVEKNFLDGKFYRYGNILAAEYSGRTGTFRAFAWSSASGRGPIHYFDEKGQAITKSFLKTPLRFVRVSSKFDRKRFHPVLHRTKAHLGIDYAAPTGTPVWASASGRVVECAHKPGSGKTVVIDHGGGLATRYYHLSRFASGMRAGRQVRQKEIIGFVGSTGLSTGPHLHFALTRNGVFVDPSKMQAVREAAVPDKAAFLAAIKPHLAALASGRGAPAIAKKTGQ